MKRPLPRGKCPNCGTRIPVRSICQVCQPVRDNRSAEWLPGGGRRINPVIEDSEGAYYEQDGDNDGSEDWRAD
jgi:hypothetical protein